MAIIANPDSSNYFLVANEPYNIEIGNVVVFEIYRGQYFKWATHTKNDDSGCSSCGGSNVGSYVITGYANCKDGFVDADGNAITYSIPDNMVEETYDNEDDIGVDESWFHETGGYNKELFTPPHFRDEYKDWNVEKSIDGNT
jgi:hypothetical protein